MGSITSRCSGNEPALIPFLGGSKTGLEKTAEIEPNQAVASLNGLSTNAPREKFLNLHNARKWIFSFIRAVFYESNKEQVIWPGKWFYTRNKITAADSINLSC